MFGVFWTGQFVKCVLYKIDKFCFMFLKAEIQAFFAYTTEHNCMVNKCTKNSSCTVECTSKATWHMHNGLTCKILFMT